MSKKFISKKASRRALTATMSLVFMISLSSCSGAVNTDGNVDSSRVYASAGDYKITYGELWNELQWSSSSVIDQQVETVVLDKYINQIETVLANTYEQYMALSEKEQTLDVENESEFNELKTKYENRLVDYVVQDIYNFNFSSKDYWDNVELIDENTAAYTEAKYIDELYSSYQLATINDKTIADLINNSSNENKEGFLTIGKALPQIYYSKYAAELLAYEKFNEEIEKAEAEDDDDDDDQLGYFTISDYVSNFKTEYTKNYDLDLISIRFTDSSELEDTLRAFGLKMYNKNIYYIDFESNGSSLNYDEYIEKYEDINLSKLNSSNHINITSSFPEAMLEIYIQIYNYF